MDTYKYGHVQNQVLMAIRQMSWSWKTCCVVRHEFLYHLSNDYGMQISLKRIKVMKISLPIQSL